MPNPPLTPENISEYLEARNTTKSAFQIFHIDYTQEEKDAIHNFNVKNAGNFESFNYYGSELDKKEVKEFLEKLGDNSKKEINLITEIIFKLLSNITKGYKTDYYWIAIRIVDFSHDFDIPRWHIDGKYFQDKLNQSKFVTVVKGPGTLLKDNIPEVKKVFHPIRDEFQKEIQNVPFGTDEWTKINNKYREKFAHELEPFETKQLTNDEGLIFFAGDENSAIHSEPKMDRQRMFISILPGSKEDIKIMVDRQKKVQNGGFYNKYQKYLNKCNIQLGGGYNYFIENIKDVNDDILKKLDENQSDCWKITDMNSSVNRKKRNYDVMYMIEKNKIIFSTYINVYKKHNYVYLNSICTSNEYRGKGLFKKALDYIKDYYKKLGFASIKLNAGNEVENGLNQKKRVEIFNKVGFEIDPILDYYDDNGNYTQTKTKVKLDNGKIVEYNKDIKNQVEKCYNDSTEYPCPMILELKK